MKNINHPKKGDIITVDPIRNPEDIDAIKRQLKDKPRDFLLFTMGINTGLRPGDLLRLRRKDLYDLQVGDTIQIVEEKTGNHNFIYININTFFAITRYFQSTPEDWNDDDYVFQSRKGENEPLTVQSVHALVNRWTSFIRMGNYGAMSMRKTWGYHARTTYHVGYDIISQRYGHSSPAITMRYIGITESEILEACKHII
jgi:integrase